MLLATRTCIGGYSQRRRKRGTWSPVAGQHGTHHGAAGSAERSLSSAATGARVRPASSTRMLPSTKRDSSTPIGASEAAGDAITTRSKLSRSLVEELRHLSQRRRQIERTAHAGKRHLVEIQTDNRG